MLYQARNIQELKHQIEIYQKARSRKSNKSALERREQKKDQGKGQFKSGTSRKCFKCGNSSHVMKDCKTDFVCFKCGHARHRAAQCTAKRDVKKETNANVVQEDKVRVSLDSEFTLSCLKLKSVVCKKIIFKGLVDTGADLCLMRRQVFMSLGAAEITGKGKSLTGIGESRVLTFGIIIISVLFQWK